MRQLIVERVLDTARYIINTGATVRAAAAHLGVSKTTVHKDMRARLIQIDPEKYREVARILEINLSQRHIRGGEATRKKYALQCEQRQS